ncbi:hypothetical protein GCM10010231_59380 [Streptomyces sindenensis]|nr:hypothetical protein GCM10010231_59380 [Streptomyces sindenensis]
MGPAPPHRHVPALPTAGPAVHELYSDVEEFFGGGLRGENRTPKGAHHTKGNASGLNGYPLQRGRRLQDEEQGDGRVE